MGHHADFRCARVRELRVTWVCLVGVRKRRSGQHTLAIFDSLSQKNTASGESMSRIFYFRFVTIVGGSLAPERCMMQLCRL